MMRTYENPKLSFEIMSIIMIQTLDTILFVIEI